MPGTATLGTYWDGRWLLRKLNTVSTFMANPMFWMGLSELSTILSVLIPTRCPCSFTNGPPLLPGLIAASVWTSSRRLAGSDRNADMRPPVTVTESPKAAPSGKPSATTLLPTWRVRTSAKGTAGNSRPSILRIARSILISSAKILAGNSESVAILTVTLRAPSTTWALVTM